MQTDETWHRLLNWTYGSAVSERLSAQVAHAEGYRSVDPSHPLGGKDGGKDALCKKDGRRFILACYFPRGQKSFSDIAGKFKSDFAGVQKNDAAGIVFITNQELRLVERATIVESAGRPVVDIIHLERLMHVLDRPAMHAVRAQYLGIDPPSLPRTDMAGGGQIYSDGSANGGGGGAGQFFGGGGGGGGGVSRSSDGTVHAGGGGGGGGITQGGAGGGPLGGGGGGASGVPREVAERPDMQAVWLLTQARSEYERINGHPPSDEWLTSLLRERGLGFKVASIPGGHTLIGLD